jgi:hypothetical protein
MKYQCTKCGATGVKLWREYNTFADMTQPMCAFCACADQGKDSSTVNSAGLRTSKHGLTDQIGYMVPAVPCGDGFWGYTTVPQDGVDWWLRLPVGVRPDDEVE